MSDQLSFASGPLARPGDPDTSHRAAAHQTIEHTTPVRAAVLLALYIRPMVDDEIITILGGSPSSCRTRRHELEEAGFVQSVGESVSSLGHPCNLWSLTEDGFEFVLANRGRLIQLDTQRKRRAQ